MTDIRPFQAVRPAAHLVSRVAALPYDVYSRQEAYEEAAKDRLSFLNIDRPETQFERTHDMYAPEVYRKAGELLHERMEEHVFIQDEQECYYLYELTMNGRTQTGLVGCASIDDYTGNIIKKHENTRPEKESDRIRHVDACSAQTGPIFLAYRRDDVISEVTERTKQSVPLFDFVTPDQVRHRGWRIADSEEIGAIKEAFHRIHEIYIADGHHRAASAVRVGLKRREEHPGYDGSEEFNYFLSVLFPDDELLILDYNRVVKDLNGLTQQQFLQRVAETCEVQKCNSRQKPREKGCMTMYLGGDWYHLRIRDQFRSSDPVEGLDVSVLQRQVLFPVLGIRDPKNDCRIDFVGGRRGLEELEHRVNSTDAVAFAMYPTSIRELFDVADAGRLMPPKSTWFEPKLLSGLFIHMIEP